MAIYRIDQNIGADEAHAKYIQSKWLNGNINYPKLLTDSDTLVNGSWWWCCWFFPVCKPSISVVSTVLCIQTNAQAQTRVHASTCRMRSIWLLVHHLNWNHENASLKTTLFIFKLKRNSSQKFNAGKSTAHRFSSFWFPIF